MKRIFNLFLIMALFTSIFASTVSANEDSEKLSLVALGDSISFGYNLEDPSTGAFPKLIAPDLFDVTNLAVPGWTSTQLLNALNENPAFSAALQGADVITLNIGNNDLLQATDFGAISRGEKELNPGELEIAVMQASLQIAHNLEQIFTIIRSHSNAPILFYDIYNPTVLGPSEFEQNLYFLADLMVQGVNTGVIRQFDLEESGIIVLDAYAAYNGNQGQYLLPGDIHPNVTGHQVLAQLATVVVENHLFPPVVEVPELELQLSQSPVEETEGPVTISLISNYDLEEMKWLAGEKTIEDFLTDGTDFEASFEVSENGQYTVFARSVNDLVGVATITVANIVKEEEPIDEDPVGEDPVTEEPPVDEAPVTEEPTDEVPVDDPGEDDTKEEDKKTPAPAPKTEDKKPAAGDKGHKLPNTATPAYNYILLGSILLLAGTASLFIQRRKKVQV